MASSYHPSSEHSAPKYMYASCCIVNIFRVVSHACYRIRRIPYKHFVCNFLRLQGLFTYYRSLFNPIGLSLYLFLSIAKQMRRAFRFVRLSNSFSVSINFVVTFEAIRTSVVVKCLLFTYGSQNIKLHYKSFVAGKT